MHLFQFWKKGKMRLTQKKPKWKYLGFCSLVKNLRIN
jgi:hypothetical protein